MRQIRVAFLLFALFTMVAGLATAQDDSQPSLGDVARQTRLKKQKEAQPDGKDQAQEAASAASSANGVQSGVQTKDGQPATSKNDAATKAAANQDASGNDTLLVKGSKKVITNEELPEHVGPTSTLPQHPRIPNTPDQPVPNADGKVPAQYWKNQIQTLKQSISNLESQIQDVTDSIRYSSGGCVSNCQQWNEQQQQKEQQVKMMTSQLEQQQKSLEEMQDTARKQGYGSSVYDP